MSSERKIAAQQGALNLAARILSGDISLFLGVRDMMTFLHTLGLEWHADFIIFTSVDSQVDHLPLEPQRHLWNRDALSEKDIEIKDAENSFRAPILEACVKLQDYLRPLEF